MIGPDGKRGQMLIERRQKLSGNGKVLAPRPFRTPSPLFPVKLWTLLMFGAAAGPDAGIREMRLRFILPSRATSRARAV